MKNTGLNNSIKTYEANKESVLDIRVGTVGGLSITIDTELSEDSYLYKTMGDLNLDLFELKKRIEWKKRTLETKPSKGS